MAGARTGMKKIFRTLYRGGADAALLALGATPVFASQGMQLPYVPWEYPCASAALVWCMAVIRRKRETAIEALLSLASFIPAFIMLTCFTGYGLLGYISSGCVPGGLSIMVYRRLPSVSSILFSLAAALMCMVPAYFLSCQGNILRLLRTDATSLLVLTLLFLLTEQLLAAAAKK